MPRRPRSHRRPLQLETLEDRILCSASPVVTVSAPANPNIGEKIPVTVSFNNTGGTNPGFGPYVDLVLDHTTGNTGTGGGVDFVVGSNTATFLGTPVTTTKLTFQAADAGHPTGPYAIHPYGKDAAGNPLTVYAPTGYGVGDTLVVLQLPFGSFTPAQSAATISLDLTVSNLAELNRGLNISARGGFQFGNDALDNPTTDPSIVGAYQSATVTPQILTLTKTYLGPENETATGPNYIRQYRLDVDIAPGQTLTNLQLSDLLPANMQFVNSGANAVQVLVHGVSTAAFSTPSTPSTTVPGGTLARTITIAGGVTGDATTAADATLIFSYYIPRIDSAAAVIVPAGTGAQNTATDTANAQGTWNPIDAGDPQNVTATAAPATHTLNVKSIATQKSVAIVTDTGAAGATPGDTLEYTIQVQVSDYFAFQNLLLSDTFSDGQRLDATFTPTFTWTEHNTTFGVQNFAGADYTVTPHYSAGDGSAIDGTDGTTGLVFNLSAEMVARGQDAKLLGGGIPNAGTLAGPLPNQPPLPFGATTVTVKFRTVIQNSFSDDAPSGNAELNPRDVLTNNVTVSGAVLSVVNATTPTGSTATDTSGTSIAIINSTVSKTIYAINGLLTTDPTFAGKYIGLAGQYLVSPGDTVTYRLGYYLPTGDVENLKLTDFLPLPIFDATQITTFDDTISAVAPAAGHAKFGPLETVRPIHGSAPTITTSAAGNSVLFNYGTTDNAANTVKNVDILFTVTVGPQPFADGLFLTNQVHAEENNTQQPAVAVTSDAIIQFQIQEPSVAVFKGVVGYNATGLTLGGIAFANPTLASSFTGTVSNAVQAAAIGASDALLAAGLDAGDKVRYAIVLQNSGRNDAFDVAVGDAVPAGYTIPASLAAMALTVRRGDGTLLALGTDYTATLNGAGALSITLTDNYSSGNTGAETGTGALSRGFNANNATAITNGSNTVVITYDLTLAPSVPQAGSTITNTATLSNYAGAEGGNNFLVTPLTDKAAVTVARPTLTKVLTGTEITGTGNNAANQAVIGEFVTYTLTLTVPEGQVPGAVLNDVLDPGLAFVDVQSVTLSAGLSATTTPGTGTAPANVTITSTGHNLAFNFGTLTNSNSSNASAETITIVYRAVVLNTNTAPAAPGNQSGSLLSNAATFSAQYTDVPVGAATPYSFAQSVATTKVTVVEPALTVTKGADTNSTGLFPASLTNVDGGDTVFYRVRIVNAAGGPTAFNTTLSDVLPAFLTSPTIFSVSGGGFTAADFTISGSTLQTVSASGLDVVAGTTLDIIVQGTISTTITVTQAFTNTANVQWSSMSGAPGTRSLSNAASTERTGADGVGTDSAVLNNYAAAPVATITVAQPSVDKRFQGGSLTADDTSVATAGTNALDRVVVGESVIYDMLVTLPEGVSQNLRVDDLIPPGMRLDLTFNGGLGYQIITAAASSNGQLAADFSNAAAVATPTLAAVNGGTLGLDGTDGRLTFGNVTVTADNVATNNSFLIRVRAIVDDVIANQAATTLNNAAQIVFTNPNTGGTTTLADATPNDHIITVIEPTLTLSKTVSTATGDAGDPVTYTITFANPNLANTGDAYDVTLADTFDNAIISPTLLTGVNFTATGFGGAFIAPTVNDFEIVNIAGSNVLRLKLTSNLDMPLGSSITLKISGTLANNVQSGQQISNTARTFWTSTDAANADERTGANVPATNLNTPDPAQLDNYGIASTTVITAVGAPIVSKSIFTTSEASTTDNFGTGLHNVAPGEIVTYRVTVALPEGVTPSFKVIDNIPLGLAYVPGSVTFFAARPDGSVVPLNAAQPGAGTAAFNGSGLAAPTVTSSPAAGNPFTEGTDVQFDFGSVTTAGDNDTNNNTFFFTYQAVVLDVAGNTGLQGAQVTRTNSVAFTVNSGASTAGVIDPGGTTATLVEPRLGVNKTVLIGGGTTGDAGDTLNYSAIISHAANSLASAFETTFADTLPPEIATPGAFTVTHSTLGDISARFQIVGNTLQTIAGQSFDLALGETVTIAFTSTLTSAVTPNETIDSSAVINYTGLTGNKNSPAYNPTPDVATDHERSYSASDNGPLTVPVATLTKTLFATSDANTAGSNLGIGETATYALKLTLPEGTTPNLSVVDLLPPGLQYVSSSVVTTAAASGGLLGADFAGSVPAPTTTGGVANGDDVTFTFTALSTTGDNAAGNNSFLILITARALDVAGNVGTTPGQTTLPNAATLDITGDGVALFTTPNVTATVVEPRLQITKSASDTTPDPGQTLTYTLTISHTASSTAIAYDVLLRDAIPANITLNTAGILVNGVAVGSSALVDSNASTTSLLDLKFTQLATGGTITISYTATVTANPSVAGANLDNNAKIYWDTDAAEDTNTVLSGGSDGTPDRDLGAVAGVEVFNVNTDAAQDTERVVVNSSTISGVVYHDANANGSFGGADTGIVGVTVALSGTDLNGNVISRTTTTIAGGAYSFTGLTAGVYTITESQPATFTDALETVGSTFGGAKSDALSSDTITGVTIPIQTSATGAGYNFGEVRTSSLAGSVYSDVNNDGIRQGGENGIATTPVRLTGTDVFGQAVLLNGTADASGNYFFDNAGVGLRPGTYVVSEVTQPAAFLDGKDTAGTSGGNATAINEQISGIVLAQNTAATGYVFGELNPVTLSGFVYHDANNDGVKQGAESAISGATVTLTGTDDLGAAVNLSTTTDGSGAYSFANLRPSNATGYTITETQPAGFLDGRDTLGTGLSAPNGAGTVGPDRFTNVSIVNVAAGNNAGANYNFGEVLAGSVSGRVFSDLNNDGLQNGADAAISGVTVALTGLDDIGNAVNLTTTTNATGDYSFSGLRPSGAAGYTLTETQPAAYLDGKETAGSTGGTIGAPPSDTITTIPVVSGANSTGNNFAELNPASLSGFVYADTNNDGVKQGAESGISGATVTLTGTNDLGAAVNLTATTSGTGAYSFTNLRPGTHVLTETQPAAFLDGKETVGTQASGTVNNTIDNNTITSIVITSGQTGAANNFGELSPASLTATVYRDLNNDGVQLGAGETGISGVTVTVTGTDDRGASVSTALVSDASGNVSFTNLRPGTYTITETQPGGFNDGLDSNGVPAGTLTNDQVSNLTVVSGTTGTGYKFGELPPTSISGTVYRDVNNDGLIAGAGETGISGVAVTLTGTDDLGAAVNVTATTDASGNYSFTGLRPSSAAGYTITETQPAGFLDGKNTAGSAGGTTVNNPPSDGISAVTLIPNTTATGYNFGELAPSTLSGSAYIDANNDGVFQVGETAQSGMTVTLSGTDDLGNAVSLSTTTNGTGAYSFGSLRPGTYTLTETQPAGLLDGRETAGTQGSGTVDNTANSNTIATITLAANTTGAANNFADLRPATLAGAVFSDGNNDGLINGGDSGISGATVALTGTDDRGNAVSTTATTGAGGAYSFAALRPGTYTISETQPAGFLDGKDVIGTPGGTSGNDVFSNVVVTEGTNGTANNFAELAPASLSGSVYIDTNNDGVRQGGESGLAGVTVTLTGTNDLGNAVSATTTTDATGAYSYGALRPSDATGYTITETQPAAYGDGTDAIGTQGGTAGNDVLSAIVLSAGVTGTGNSFGERIEADLSITKTDGSASYIPGTAISYTVVVSNGGPSFVTGATIADTIPANISGAAWTAVYAGVGSGGAASGSGNISTAINLASGGSASFTITGTVLATATGNLVNTATVAAPAGVTDPTPGNNSATDTDTANITADLSITKTDGSATYIPGAAITYTVVVSNTGPSFVTGATVADTLPANISGAAWAAVYAGTGSSGAASGSGDISTLINLASGGTATFTVTGTALSTATGDLVNTATVAAPAGVTDLTPGNNSATDTDTANITADLAITKTDGSATYIPGTAITYTVVVTNSGPSFVTGATVSDTIAANISGATWTAVYAGTGSSGAASGSGDINTAINLASGGSATFTVTGTVLLSATGSLTNTATVTAPAGLTDPTPGNNSANDTDTRDLTSLSGFVYSDANNDGTRQGAESGILGATVTLTGTNNLGQAVNVTVLTLADGSYSFINLRPSNAAGYTITETQPAVFLDGKDTVGTPGGTAGNDVFGTVVLAKDVIGVDNNFGELAPASLAGSVYLDLDNDGLRDAGESGVPGVTITLSGTDDIGGTVTLTATTSNMGAYSFTNLRPSSGAGYTLTETQPAYPDGTDAIGTQGGTTGNDVLTTAPLTAGTNGTGNNFGELFNGVLGKSIVGSSLASTTGSSLAVGETVRYRLVVSVPFGTLNDFQLAEALPAGLVFLNDGTAAVGLVSASGASLTSSGVSGAGLTAIGTPGALLPDAAVSTSATVNNDTYASGTEVFFKLGTLTNTDTNGATAESVVIEFNARVVNEIANQAGTGLSNTFALRYDSTGDGVAEDQGGLSPATPATVVEPSVTMGKTLVTAGSDAGDAVQYTITLTNASGANVSTAFDLRVQDLLSADLVFGSVSASGATISTNNTTGNALDVTLDQLAPGASATITINATVANTAVAGATIGNAASLTFSSLPGADVNERDGSGGVNGHTGSAVSADFTLVQPSMVKTGPADTTYSIGEQPVYRITVTLPEGVTQNVSVRDLLPVGLEYISASLDFTGSAVTPFALPAPVLTGDVNSGTQVAFNLGTLQNLSDNNAANNSFTIVLTARAADIAGNVPGTVRTNDAELDFIHGTTGATTLNTPADPTVSIVEPKLQIAKAVSDATPDIGQTLTFTLTITHTGVSAADAFDLMLRDATPAGLTLNLGSIVVNGATLDADNTTATGLDLRLDALTLGGTITITYQATVDNTLANVGGGFSNNARLFWDSLPADETDNAVLNGNTPDGTPDRDYGATPGYAENATPGVDDPAQDTVGGAINTNAIAGTVYRDNDSDGALSAGDSAISGVALSLTGTTATGLAVSLTTGTDGSGAYSFGTLAAGTYLITETQPAGYIDGTETAGNPASTFGGTVSGVLGSNTIATITIPAQSNTTEGNYNFGETLPSSVAGSVYLDDDNDGARDVAESGVANVPVTLTGTDIYGQAVTLNGSTDGAGLYTFPNLRPGTYTVTEDDSAVVPAPWLDGKDTPGTSGGALGGVTPKFDQLTGLALAQNTDATGYNFGELRPASLAGSVFIDADGDATRDAGETGIGGATVTLSGTDDLGNAVSATATTAADGSFSFTTLRPGTYTITETQPALYGDGGDAAGTLGGSVANDVLSNIAVAAGQAGTGNSFGELGAQLSGTVFVDADKNGALNGEAGLGGVTLQLLDAGSNVVGSVTTAADGSYTFSNLPAGSYTVVETQPNAYGSSTANSVPATVPVGGLTGVNFGETTGSLAGTVYHDSNNNGAIDLAEPRIVGATVTLTGTDLNGGAVTATTTSDASGNYQFTGLLAGTYTVTETQPAGYRDGLETAGTGGGNTTVNDVISAIGVGLGSEVTGYLFGERTLPDLVVTKDDGVTTVRPGQLVTYTMTLRNQGLQDASGVVVSDQFPVNDLEFVSASAGGVFDATAGTITWNLGGLTGSGAEVVTLTITARVKAPVRAGVETVENIVTVMDDGTSGPDATPENNTAKDTDQLLAAPDLYVLKTDNLATAKVGQQTTYTITGGNAGDQVADGVIITDSLPPGLRFVSASLGGRLVGGQVVWNLGQLAAGATFQLTVTVAVEAAASGTNAVNSVTIADRYGSHEDPTPANNTATDPTRIDVFNAFVFAYDSFHDFGLNSRRNERLPLIGSIDLAPDALLPLAPIYSGEADPGATLVVSLYNAKGEQIGAQTVVVDAGGNWLTTFASSTMRDTPSSVRISMLPAPASYGDSFGHNLRAYFSPALNPGHFFETVRGLGFDRSSAPLLDGLGLENPLQLGSVKYGGELLSTQGTASGE